MKVIEEQENRYTTKYLLTSHVFEGFPNIVCSGSKIYQIPCTKGLRSYPLRELVPKYHNGSVVYLIDKRRITTTKLKRLAQVKKVKVFLEKVCTSPF